MQPTSSRQTPGVDAGAVLQSSYTPGSPPAGRPGAPGGGETPETLAADQNPGEGDGTLDDAARREREDMRPRLRDELGREPTEEELDEWLRRHTESY